MRHQSRAQMRTFLQLSGTQFPGGLVVGYRHGERGGQKIAECCSGDDREQHLFFWVASEGWHGPESGLEYDYEKIRAIGIAEKAVQPGECVDIVIGTFRANQLAVESALPGKP